MGTGGVCWPGGREGGPPSSEPRDVPGSDIPVPPPQTVPWVPISTIFGHLRGLPSSWHRFEGFETRGSHLPLPPPRGRVSPSASPSDGGSGPWGKGRRAGIETPLTEENLIECEGPKGPPMSPLPGGGFGGSRWGSVPPPSRFPRLVRVATPPCRGPGVLRGGRGGGPHDPSTPPLSRERGDSGVGVLSPSSFPRGLPDTLGRGVPRKACLSIGRGRVANGGGR